MRPGLNLGDVKARFTFKGIAELTREVVVTLIDRIYIFEDKHIRINFNFRNELAYYQEILQQQEVS